MSSVNAMRSSDRAIRLLERVGIDEGLIGDLIEQRHAGRSALWLWWQTVMTIVARIRSDLRRDPTPLWCAAGAVAIALVLPYVWRHVVWDYAVRLDVTWYPATIDWLARSSPDGVWNLVRVFRPWSWTSTAAWCALLASTAWLLVRVRPKERVLILTVFTLSNMAQGLPSLGRLFLDWSTQPANPMRISNFVWFAILLFVAIPLSIYAGGRLGHRRNRVSVV